MLDIIQSVSMMNISVDEVKTMNREDHSVYELTCFVTGLKQLDRLIINLSKNTYIEKVERAIRWEY